MVSGSDPGLRNLGLALVEVRGARRRCVMADVVTTKPGTDIEDRLDELCGRALAVYPRADLVALEDQFGVWQGADRAGETNADARRVEDVLSMLRGVALALGRRRRVLTPGQIRARLGLPGGASKAAVERMVRLLVQGVPEGLADHGIDAIAVAVAASKDEPTRAAVRAARAGGRP